MTWVRQALLRSRFWLTATLIAVIVATGFSVIARSIPLPPALSAAAGSASDMLAREQAIGWDVAPTTPKITLIDIDNDALAARLASAGSSALTAAPRQELAQLLDFARGSGARRPRVVILDVDVSTPTSANREDAQKEERIFLEALQRWVDDAASPRLILVRGAGCGWPLESEQPQESAVWSATPFDARISESRGRISWACAMLAIDSDGVARRAATWACTDDGTATRSRPSPHALLGGLDSPATAAMDEACRGDRRQSEAKGLMPVSPIKLAGLAPDTQAIRRIPALEALGTTAAELQLGDIVGIGQTHMRAGDRYLTSSGYATPGVEIVTWQARAALIEGIPTLPSLAASLLATISATIITIALYLGVREARTMLVNVTRPQSAARVCMLFLFGPIAIQAGVTSLVMSGAVASLSMWPGRLDFIAFAIGVLVGGGVIAAADFVRAVERPQQEA